MKARKMFFMAALCVAANAANATLFTFSSSGTIDKNGGYDYFGFFGSPQRYLSELPFSLSVSFNLEHRVENNADVSLFGFTSVTPFTYSVSVGDKTYSSIVQPTSSRPTWSYVVNTRSVKHTRYDGIGSDTRGVDDLGRQVAIIQDILSYSALVGSADPFTQPFTYSSHSGDQVNLTFAVASPNGQTRFTAHGPITITTNSEPAVSVPEPAVSVPEPATAMLFGAGLLGVAAVRRRQTGRVVL